MSYRVKEIFASLQGEGMNLGRTAVLLRFAGCNLWSGREEHRSSAVCRFCDTDFVGTDGINGGTFGGAEELAQAVEEVWTAGRHDRFVVCTGGEPLLQLDDPAIDALHDRGFTVAVETNGTRPVPRRVDWLCVSPKAGAELVVTSGDELKLVYPQEGADPAAYEALDFDHFLLSPMDGPELALNTKRAVEFCADHPRWRLTIQAHKYLGIR
ncbi:MAG: 7-carboxy-7-deazaguanine synthase [Acidimicrobiales bacterium]|nr:MAG: 7-carboxy-7-deazaguanine synthase [Actinomycetota bacterium]MBV6507419.1 7-carboxy-7-deazaguanine synthase [Acidimicrobiales bacterium]RIK07801.1 MAG: 7-carboxy-7-deazaguanine synthase [Acidobacteriota bacterium]